MGKNSKAIRKQEREMKKKQLLKQSDGHAKGHVMTVVVKEPLIYHDKSSVNNDIIEDEKMLDEHKASNKLAKSRTKQCITNKRTEEEGMEETFDTSSIQLDSRSLIMNEQIDVSSNILEEKVQISERISESKYYEASDSSSSNRMFDFKQLLNHFKKLEKTEIKTPRESYLQERLNNDKSNPQNESLELDSSIDFKTFEFNYKQSLNHFKKLESKVIMSPKQNFLQQKLYNDQSIPQIKSSESYNLITCKSFDSKYKQSLDHFRELESEVIVSPKQRFLEQRLHNVQSSQIDNPIKPEIFTDRKFDPGQNPKTFKG